MLRTRLSGGDALVDVHIQVDPALSVSEGHCIGEKVRGKLIAEIEAVADVTVHIDREDDETNSPCDHLPLREDILQTLRVHWDDLPAAGAIKGITLQYLDGKIHLDMVLPLELAPDRAAAALLQLDFQQRAGRVEGIGEVRLYFG
jgi:hypothetical protein